MEFWLPVGLVVVVLAGFAFQARWRQRKLLARLRAEWGHPTERTRDISAIAHYHRVFAADHEFPLDVRTGEDLNLDAVFAVLDRTESSIGQQLLYHRLRTTPASDNRAAFEALMTRFVEDARSRERIQALLSRLRGHPTEVWWLTQPGILETKRRDAVFPVLGLFVPAALLLTLVWSPALVAVILGVITNMIVRYATAPRLGPPLHPFRQVAPLLAAAEIARPLIASHGLPIGPSLSSDLARLRRLRRIAGWVGHDPMMSDDLTSAIHEAANMILLLDLALLVLASREIRANGPALLRTVASVGTVDAAIGVASYRTGAAGWTRPVFEPPSGAWTLLGLRHPLLPEAVPNSIELAPPRGVLVTGSNMSGKSTFLRTVGVTAILAQTVNTCLATCYRAPVLHVRSVIGRGDDLTAGRSYYRDEVEAVLSLVLASRSTRPHLFLFDELFRGTSTVERIAAAEATLVELIPEDGAPSPHIVIAATHDRELVALLERTYAPFCFTDSIDAGGLSFDYRLRRGLARSWNAIALLEACGAPPRLVERALARTADLGDQRRPGETGPAGE